MEIGSFLELDLKKTGEYFNEESTDIAKLNSGRSGILYAMKLLNCTIIYLPYYLCPEVREFLILKGISIKYYHISNDLIPVLEKNETDTAVLLVNHFGILSENLMMSLRQKYRNVIIDNCASFFSSDLPGCYNVYSCRKFFGVPDGSYVVGPDASINTENYPIDQSSGTSSFLLERIEQGCSAVYSDRMKNESRINGSGLLRMSKLTSTLLSSLDYQGIKEKRSQNYCYADKLFKPFNMLNLSNYTEASSIPLFYPLVVRDMDLVRKLQEQKIYTGRRWNSVIREVDPGSFEALLANYMVPIPIDQRYGENELDYCFKIFCDSIKL